MAIIFQDITQIPDVRETLSDYVLSPSSDPAIHPFIYSFMHVFNKDL